MTLWARDLGGKRHCIISASCYVVFSLGACPWGMVFKDLVSVFCTFYVLALAGHDELHASIGLGPLGSLHTKIKLHEFMSRPPSIIVHVDLGDYSHLLSDVYSFPAQLEICTSISEYNGLACPRPPQLTFHHITRTIYTQPSQFQFFLTQITILHTSSPSLIGCPCKFFCIMSSVRIHQSPRVTSTQAAIQAICEKAVMYR